MIRSVKKLREGTFLINGNCQVSNINFDNGDIFCDIDYNENELTEEAAHELSSEFISEALTKIIADQKK